MVDRTRSGVVQQSLLGVPHHGTAADDDAMTRKIRPPTEVDVIAEQRELGVKAAKVVPHVAPHQHARRAYREDIAVTVVLAVIKLAWFEPCLASTTAVDRRTNLEQHRRVVPVAQFRADDAGRGHLVREFEHGFKCAGRRRAVVVQQPGPLDHRTRVGAGRCESWCAGERRHRQVDRGAEPGLPRGTQDAGGAYGPFQQLATVVVAAGIDGHEALHGSALGLDRVQRRGQPASAVMGNEHRCDDVTGADQTVGSDGR